MQRIYKTAGIILKRRNISEADRVLTVFTPYLGKISLLAKGIRRIRSRRGPHVELFQNTQLTIAHGKTWDIVVEAQTREVYPALRGNLQLLAYAYRLAEIVDQLCAEGQSYPGIFPSLHAVLRQLETTDADTSARCVDQFTVLLLHELGYLPRTEHISGAQLQGFLQSVTERTLRSDRLLDKVI